MADHHTLVVGAGFAGIGAAIALDRAGLSDYRIIEAGDAPGGTWYWNTYPGIAVDIPSFSYQFSFEQSPDWSRTYAPGHELRAYAEHCVDKYGLRERIRFGTEVHAATFDEAANVAAAAGLRRRTDLAVPDQRHRCADRPEPPRHPGRRRLRRHHHAHRAVGSAGGPAR